MKVHVSGCVVGVISKHDERAPVTYEVFAANTVEALEALLLKRHNVADMGELYALLDQGWRRLTIYD